MRERQQFVIQEAKIEQNTPDGSEIKSQGRSMGNHMYRGNHRSDVRGKGQEAFFRNNWMKRFKGGRGIN